MSSTTLNLSGPFYEYYQHISVRAHPILKELASLNGQSSSGLMQIAPEQGQFMMWLVRALGVKKALEIGTYTGYSALCTALALPEDGQLTCCEVSQECIEIAKPFWEKAYVSHKITVKIGPALESLEALLNEGAANSFDFIFIDADKRTYPTYYEKSLALVRQGGIIALDNVFRNGKVAQPAEDDKASQVIHALNQQLHEDTRIGDGLSLAYKR